MNNQEGKRPYGIKEGSMPDPDNNSINRQPIIINLRKGKGHMTDNMTQGTVLERLLYHCKTWNNHKNNIMKREKEFKEYLKDKRIDLTSCIRTYTDYDTFVEKYREYDKEYELEHYIKDENGNMVHVELVCVKAEKDMVMTWKDTETGKIFQTKE